MALPGLLGAHLLALRDCPLAVLRMSYEGVQKVAVEFGRHGIWGQPNKNRVPRGAPEVLRNITIEDLTFRTLPGATTFGGAIPGVPKILCATDYWPTVAVQRTVVFASDGIIYKDNLATSTWTALLGVALATAGSVPMFCLGGAESGTTNDRKCFFADAINEPKVIRADGAAAVALTNPPLDWATKKPRLFVVAEGFLFGAAGNTLYGSVLNDHEDFLSDPFTLPVGSGDQEYISCALSFKGGMVVWKYPASVFYINTSNADRTTWFPSQVGSPGAAGPLNAIIVNNYILWIAPNGTFHLMIATQAQGSMVAEDLMHPQLGNSWARDHIDLRYLNLCQAIFHGEKNQAMFAVVAAP